MVDAYASEVGVTSGGADLIMTLAGLLPFLPLPSDCLSVCALCVD